MIKAEDEKKFDNAYKIQAVKRMVFLSSLRILEPLYPESHFVLMLPT